MSLQHLKSEVSEMWQLAHEFNFVELIDFVNLGKLEVAGKEDSFKG